MNFDEYRSATEYNAEKENKRTNFIFLNEKYCEKHQTVLAGDSITEIFNMELFDEYKAHSGYKVYNRGISGDTSDRLLERFDDTVLSLEPSALVFLVGTNDLTLIDDVDYVFGNIVKCMDKAIPVCDRILVQSVYPVSAENREKNKNIVALNTLLEQMCKVRGITYLDLHGRLSDVNGEFVPAYTYDGLHPNALGFEIAAREIVSALK